jgi:cell division protein FtsQ
MGRRIALVASLAAGVTAAGGWWATHSSIFGAHDIGVTGESHLSRSDVLRAAGIGGSTNVLWANTAAIAAAVESNPWVASASVTRSLPSTIRIEVTERRPASTVIVGATWFLVAADGTVLGPAQHRPHLPVLPTVAAVTVGDRSRTFVVPAAVAGGMSPWLRSQVATISPGTGGLVQLGLADGVQVLFGPATDLQAKAQALVGILAWANDRHTQLATIDVRSPLAPAAILLDSIQPDPAVPPGANAMVDQPSTSTSSRT